MQYKNIGTAVLWKLWDVSKVVLPFTWRVFKRSGEILIGIVAFVPLMILVSPLHLLKKLFPGLDTLVDPIIYFIQSILYWWPRSIWSHICGLIKELILWSIMLNIVLARFINSARKGQLDLQLPRLSVIIRRIYQFLKKSPIYFLEFLLIILLSFSMLAQRFGFIMMKIDDVFDKLIRFFVTEDEIEETRDGAMDFAERLLELEEESELSEEIFMSYRVMIETSEEIHRETKEDISRGEFLISILIAVAALTLTFFPGLENIGVRVAPLGREIDTNLLFVLQTFLSVVTFLLLFSVVIRTRLIDYLKVDDLSIFDDQEDIYRNAAWNEKYAPSPGSILFISDPVRSVSKDVEPSEKLADSDLSRRELRFREIHDYIEDMRPDD